MMRRVLLVPALLGAMASAAGAQQDDAVGRAMRDELARSMKELRLPGLEAPYFIAYRVIDHRSTSASASYGSLLGSGEDRARMLSVEVRVGDYAFDNTNFAGMGGGGMMISLGGISSGFGGGDLPIDDDYLAIRRRIWLATDRAYKRAVEQYSAKKAALLNRARADSLPDFSRETATQTIDTQPSEPLPRADAESLVRMLSNEPALVRLSSSSVSLESGEVIIRYVNSEGTTYTRSRPLMTVMAGASTQATDGYPLAASAQVHVPVARDLPTRDQLRALMTGLALRIDSLRTAPLVERYSGPVLIEERAAAELFSSVFAPALAARRRPASGEPGMVMFGAMGGDGRMSFSDRIGSRVLPELLTVIDDPTIARYGDETVLGSYKVDDEGVPGRRKVLVDAGILRSLLSTRNPVEGMPRSSGNDRGAGPAPSNLIVESSVSESDTDLKSHLQALVRKRGLPYGIVVREIGAAATFMPEDPMAMVMAMQDRVGGQRGGRPVVRAYRVYPDGREEMVRGARLMDVSPQSFKDVVGVSTRRTVYHRAAGGMGPDEMFEELMAGEAQPSAMASFVVPSLLFEDLTITKPVGQTPRPPLSTPPGGAPGSL